MKIGEAIDEFAIYLKAEGKSPKTVDAYIPSLQKLGAWLNGNCAVDTLDAVEVRHLRRYIADLRSRKPMNHKRSKTLADATIRGHIIAIKRFFVWLRKEGFMSQNVAETISVPTVHSKVVMGLSLDEIGRLLTAVQYGRASARNKAMILLFLDSGLRSSELTGLRPCDIDFDGARAKILGKGSRERFVPLGDLVRCAIKEYMNDGRPRNGEYLFLTREGNRLSKDRMRQFIHLAAIKAGITRRCYPHLLRHTFAINFLRYGGGEFALQRILGHSTLEMTRRYSYLLFDDIAEAHRRASPMDRML